MNVGINNPYAINVGNLYLDEEPVDSHEVDAGAKDPITQDDFEEPAVLTPCNHVFSKASILSWLTNGVNRNCPVCRTGLYYGALKIINELKFKAQNPPPQARDTRKIEIIDICSEDSDDSDGVEEADNLKKEIQSLKTEISKAKKEYKAVNAEYKKAAEKADAAFKASKKAAKKKYNEAKKEHKKSEKSKLKEKYKAKIKKYQKKRDSELKDIEVKKDKIFDKYMQLNEKIKEKKELLKD